MRRTVIVVPASLAYGAVGFICAGFFFALASGQWVIAIVEALCLAVLIGVLRSSKKSWLPSPGANADSPNLQPSDTLDGGGT